MDCGLAPNFLAEHRLSALARARACVILTDVGDGPGPLTDANPDQACDLWEAEGGRRLQAILGVEAIAITESLRRRGLVRICGFPPEGAPGPSPYSGHAPSAPLTGTLVTLFGIIRLMGAQAFAFSDENGGQIVRHVVARENAVAEVSSQGWGAELPWHMDGAFRPFSLASHASPAPPPRWLVFGIVKTRPDVPMIVASLDEVVHRLSPDVRSALEQPEFVVSTPDAVATPRNSGPVPLLCRDARGAIVSRISLGNCVGLTPRADTALTRLTLVLRDPALACSIPVDSGDVVVLDNWRMLHRRAAYQPRWNGDDRWFVRLFARPTAENMRTRVYD